MLRVGLTGGLGAGKSAVAAVWAQAGVHVLSADAVGRALMEPGQPVYRGIVERFGPGIVTADGHLDRKALATEAFERGRLGELNALVHPAVLAEQERVLGEWAAADPEGIAAVESALIFEVQEAGGRPWRERFDRLVLVAASEELKVARYAARVGGDPAAAERDARARLRAQVPDEQKIPLCDWVIWNEGSLEELSVHALEVLAALRGDGPPGLPSRAAR